MIKKIAPLAIAALIAPLAFSNTPLLVNTNFNGWTPWVVGTNKFQPKTTWLAFVSTLDPAPPYTHASRISPSGSGFVFQSWDDGTSDRLETYLFQEFKAGPATSNWPTIFNTGDVLVFKGAARSTKTGANTADVVTRAFIKTLGYNDLGWEFQTKTQYSAFQPLTTTTTPFDLTVTYPDLAVDDSLQVIQIGFEITTEYDGTAMDSATIYFENLEAYVVGEETRKWAGYDVRPDGYADTGSWLGWVYVNDAPWIWLVSLNNYAYIQENAVTAGGGWAYVQGQ